MPLKNSKGKILSELDLSQMRDMLEGSLEQHIQECNRLGRQMQSYGQRDDVQVYAIFASVYASAIETLETKISEAATGAKDLTTTEFMNRFYDGLVHQALAECKENGLTTENAQESLNDTVNLASAEANKYVLGETELPEIDRDDAIRVTAAPFKLATEPMPGVERFETYNPNSDSVSFMLGARSGNSTSLKQNLEDLKAEIEEFQDPNQHKDFSDSQRKTRLNELREKYDKKFSGDVGLAAGAETSRIMASELMMAEHVEASDLVRAFTELNKAVRVGDPNGGKLRGGMVNFGDISAVASTRAPSDMLETMDMIADNMNKIRQTADPALQRTQAIQLAAFAYQMTLSEHLFQDGNGRSCRLLADTILQSFGLPPHVPTKKETAIAGSIGKPLNFEKGAKVFLNGVQKGSEALAAQRAEEAVRHPETAKTNRAIPVNPRVNAAVEKGRAAASVLDKINDTLVETTRAQLKEAGKAKSVFHNSTEYIRFHSMLSTTNTLIEAINAGKKAGATHIDLAKLDSTLQAYAQKAGLAENGQVSMENSAKLFKDCFQVLKQTGKAYETYKMKDHTYGEKPEPGKKTLNKDDIRKLNVIHAVLGEPPVRQQAQPEAQKETEGPKNVL